MANSNQGNEGGNKGGGSKQSATGARRGFAAMNPEQQREIASLGGRAAHAAGTAHRFTSEEARKAGSMSHKNSGGNLQSATGGSRSGEGGESSAGNGRERSAGAAGTRGGTPEQHAEAGRQRGKK
jgi:hypothetical protein